MVKNITSTSLLGYGVALLAVVAATLIRLALQPAFGGQAPFVFFILAVIVTAWFGGRGPGLLTTALGAMAGAYLFLEPLNSFAIAKSGDRGTVGLYILIGVFVSIFIGALQSAKQRAEIAVNQAQREIEIRQQREQALRDSERRFRELADSMPQLVWTADSDGIVDYYNSRVAEYASANHHADSDKQWEPLLHPDDLEPTRAVWQVAAATEQPYSFEHRMRMADGSYRWHLSRAMPVRGEAGGIVKWFGTATDIHDLREAQEAFHGSQNMLTLAMRSSRMGAWSRDIATNQVWWSAELEEIFGLEANGFAGNEAGFYDFVHADDRKRLARAVEQAIAERTDYVVEFRFYHQDGSIHWMEGRGRALYSADGEPLRLYGIGIDITERKQIEAERERLFEREQQARAVAEQANRLKDEFLATVSHELRTPLNAMMGWAVMLRSGKLDEKTAARALETIERNTRSQSKLIEDLLDVSRIISGKLRLDIQEIELVPIIHAAIDVIRPAADAKEIDLQITLDASVGRIAGDSNRIQQIIWNLLSNAIKFTPQQGRVEIQLKQRDSQVEISVTDTGKGISQAFLPHVFDRFRQADNSTSRLYSGLGLGLAIVRHLVELHGGMVWADSLGEDLGATFTVKLPLLVSDNQMNKVAGNLLSIYPTTANKLVAKPPSLQGLRVLVVDDEIDGREMLKRVLLDCEAQVTTCASASEALDLLQSYKPDVLVSDIGMPGEDGYTLIKRVRALEPECGGQIPAIALTAYTRMEDRMQAIAAGFQIHASKPIEPAELILALANITGRTPAPESAP